MNSVEVIRMVKCTTCPEWDAARRMRQKYFFDLLSITDPYTWTFDHPEHVHFVIYKSDVILGYAHIQLWPEKRAALRIIVIDEQHRKLGLGGQFLQLCEQWLKIQGVKSIHDEARKDVVSFYRKQGYIEMPFNDPTGEPPSPLDVAMGKFL